MANESGPDPAFAAAPSSQSSLSRPSGLQSGVGFTPGPWVLWIAAGEGPRVLDSNCGTEIVAYRDIPKSAVVLAERNANARLIATAPELYAALQRLAACSPDSAAVELALGVLAKARGEA